VCARHYDPVYSSDERHRTQCDNFVIPLHVGVCARHYDPAYLLNERHRTQCDNFVIPLHVGVCARSLYSCNGWWLVCGWCVAGVWLVCGWCVAGGWLVGGWWLVELSIDGYDRNIKTHIYTRILYYFILYFILYFIFRFWGFWGHSKQIVEHPRSHLVKPLVVLFED
jgi:dolichol kinase